MKQKAKFLFFCMIFVGSGVFAQQKALQFPLKAPVDTIHTHSSLGKNFMNYFRKNISDTMAKESRIIIRPISYLPGDYYSAHLGFVCRQEIRLEKSTGIPFRFRLGSVQQVDWLEGKSTVGGYQQLR